MALEVWHQRVDLKETLGAYHAFCHVRDLPARIRSSDRAFTVCKLSCPRDKQGKLKDPSQSGPPPDALPRPLKECGPDWKKWKKKFQWELRCAEYDAHVQNTATKDRIEQIRQMDKRHSSLAVAFLNKVVERIQQVDAKDLSPGMLLAWLEKATVIERRARGQATEIVAEQRPDELEGVAADEIRQELLGRLDALREKLEG